MSFRLGILLLAGCLALAAQQDASPAERYKLGHSAHGTAFDVGPREKPWPMPGAGKAHFPITTRNPEVQRWFDQGHVLLHDFWEFEAERAFRWARKLEPENAMVYWGLARAADTPERAQQFLREAVKRKHTVTERERLYIEAWEAQTFADPLAERSDTDRNPQHEKFKRILETIIVRYPDDIEAKSLLAIASLGDSRVGNEQILQQVLARQPDHPGAHHYRIHNWNSHEPEVALDSCAAYGKIAPDVGHAQHMPGHVYSAAGMWQEAAISMDSATRVEKRYMRERMLFPFNAWNYAHNRNYLSYIQEQLGMANAALAGARQLVEAPLDPQHNEERRYSTYSQGIRATVRGLVKFERWKELLDAKAIPWRDLPHEKLLRHYAEARAHLGLNSREKAEASLAAHAAMKKDLEKTPYLAQVHEVQDLELKGRLALLRGDTILGLAKLSDAAERQAALQRDDNDPPGYPEVVYLGLGRAYLQHKSPTLAVGAFEKALELTRNDWFAYAGLVEAHHALGDMAKARDAMAKLLAVTSDADPNLRLLEQAKATGVTAGPRDPAPAKQRNYKLTQLEFLGPNTWEPYPAPQLAAADPEGKPVTLDAYRGKNVLLVFYLGQECAHCMEQLQSIAAKKDEWAKLDTVVLAVSANTPQANAEALKRMGDLPYRLLSDRGFENARRFKSYDDFEEMELHSTILIDKLGRVHWARHGGDPFTDLGFLTKELGRMNEAVAKAGTAVASR